MKVALAGAGAFGQKHLDGIARIDGVEVVSIVGRRLEQAQEIADKYGVAHVTTDLTEAIESQPGYQIATGSTNPNHSNANSIGFRLVAKHGIDTIVAFRHNQKRVCRLLFKQVID